MKIAFLCNEYPPRVHGGLGRVLYDLTQWLADAGHDITVVEWGKENRSRFDNKVQVVEIKTINFRGMAWFINRLRLKNYLEKNKFDIIEIPDFQGLLPFRIKSCPVVVRLHQMHSSLTRVSPILKYCEKQTLHKHSCWIAPSSHMLKNKMRPEKSIVIPHGIASLSEDPFQPPFPPEQSLLYVGDFTDSKGGHFALDIFSKLPKDQHLIFIGALAPDVVPDRVHFAASIPHPQLIWLMKRCRILLLPSIVESFSLTAAEALCCGCPILAPDIPPYTELGITHLLPPREREAWVSQINKLLSERGHARKSNDLGKLINRFSIEKMASKTIKMYESLTHPCEKIS